MQTMVSSAPRRHVELSGVDDAELVAMVRMGDGVAYAELYRRHHAVVQGVVRKRLGRQGESADVVQEVFAIAWGKLASLRDDNRFRAWVLQIAHRTAIDHGRRFRRAPLDRDVETRLEEVADLDLGPEEHGDLSELVRSLGAGIASLSRREATAVTLAGQLGLSAEEIAGALGVSPGNARIILHRARRRLRSAIA